MRWLANGPTTVARLDPRRRRNGAEAGGDGAGESTAPLSRLGAFRLGLEGGVVATIALTAFRMPITNVLPPTAPFLAEYVGGDPEDYPVLSLVLHVVYGTFFGGVFGLLFEGRFLGPDVTKEKRGFVLGIPYGLAMSAFGTRVVLERLLGMDLDPDERWIFHASHLVYGVTLGTWYGSKT